MKQKLLKELLRQVEIGTMDSETAENLLTGNFNVLRKELEDTRRENNILKDIHHRIKEAMGIANIRVDGRKIIDY